MDEPNVKCDVCGYWFPRGDGQVTAWSCVCGECIGKFKPADVPDVVEVVHKPDLGDPVG